MAYPEKKTSHTGIFLICFVLVLGIVLFFLMRMKDDLAAQIGALKTAAAYLKSEYRFAELTVTGKDVEKISFTLRLLDPDGNARWAAAYTLIGSDIFLESRVVLVEFEPERKAFVFPYRVYTDRIPEKQGVNFLTNSISNKIPVYYYSRGADMSRMKAVQAVFETAFYESDVYSELKQKHIPRIFDTSVHQSVIKPFEEGKTYSFIIHPNGGVELMEESYGSDK